jgi:penicillin-binding protein 1C
MRDNWCVGYSDRYTVGVWIGNFSGEPMWDVSGVTGAAPVWLDIMQRLHRSDSSAPRTPPPGVVSMTVRFKDLGRTRREWFLSGTETPEIRIAPGVTQRRIRYPAPGTIIALDPDIPEGLQRIFFEADAGTSSVRWDLDGQSVGAADSLVFWAPRPGRHRLSLLDDSDRVLDSVEFEVRGSLP